VHEANQPDVIGDFADADVLTANTHWMILRLAEAQAAHWVTVMSYRGTGSAAR